MASAVRTMFQAECLHNLDKQLLCQVITQPTIHLIFDKLKNLYYNYCLLSIMKYHFTDLYDLFKPQFKKSGARMTA